MSQATIDWTPASSAVQDNQIAAYDDLRQRCPVAYSESLNWSVFRHDDVMRILLDHDTFSNCVSAHPAVPNGMDPPEHTSFRRIIDPYFDASAMAGFEPVCRRIAAESAARLMEGEVDLMAEIAGDFALDAQCAFMGWPDALRAPLADWVRRNADATRAGDRAATAAVAADFAAIVGAQLDARRAAGPDAPRDTTSRLLDERRDGTPLTDAEITSIVRNWTVGELGTIAASIGIVLHHLAEHPDLQDTLRRAPDTLSAAIDEILRLHAPLIANRRITTCPVDIGGRSLPAGARLSLIWASANRDETVFGDPDAFEPERNAARNILYGAGIHICPGAPLARLELCLVIGAILARTRRIRLASDRPAIRAAYPGSGFRSLPLRIEIAGEGAAA